MSKVLRLLCLILFGALTLCGNTLRAQVFSFKHYSVSEGLPSYSVISITQDKRGFLWFGTTDGLCRYDGVRFKIYKRTITDTDLLSNNIISLFSDSKGILWVGTSAGLNKYNEQKDVFEKVNISNGQTESISVIYEEKNGQLWVGGTKGLYKIDHQKVSKLQYFNNYSVKTIFEDHEGKIWVGADDRGVTLVEKTNQGLRFTEFSTLLSNSKFPAPENVSTIGGDADNNIWIGTKNNGVFQFDPVSGNLKHFQTSTSDQSKLVNNNVRQIFLDKNKQLWIATQEGINLVRPGQKDFLTIAYNAADKTSLSQNSVYRIFQDSNGSIWIGTYFGGVNLCYAYNTNFGTFQTKGNLNSISNNVISSIIEDRNRNLWIGTEGGGLNFYNTNTGIFSAYKHIPNNPSSLGSNLVKAVYLDRDGNVWSGTHGGGLNVLVPGSNIFKKYVLDSTNVLGNEISSIKEDPSHNFWVASNAGIKVFKRTGTNLVPQPLVQVPPATYPTYFFTDTKNGFWVGSASGIHLITGNGVQQISNSYGVTSFAEDQFHNIWMGTENNGLVKYDPKTKQLTETKNQFLESAPIYGLIAQSDGTLWVSTNKGLVHFDAKTNNIQVYTTNDGTAGNEFNYNSFLRSSDGQFYFGGFNGITYFLPDAIKTNPFVAPIVFTSLKIQNETVQISNKESVLKENIVLAPALSFSHDQNLFTIDFALLNYIKSEKNTYRYRLEGFDKDWEETSNAAVTYTNLPSGDYVFKVKGANNDGVWSDVASLKIVINPPFWLTWWAYTLYIIMAACIIFIIARFFFLRELIKKEEELHQTKLDFFTNASHEIRTHLTLIMAPIDRLLSENKKDSFLQQQLSRVKLKADRLLSLVSELMDFRKAETKHLNLYPQQQNLIPFLQGIYDGFMETSLSKNISMSFLHDEDLVPVNVDGQQLEKVFFNLMANAFKFTPDGGKICLQVTTTKDKVSVAITDNGRGIDPKYLPKLFTNFFQVADHGLQNTGYGIGLALAKNIVELHDGTIVVESETPQENKEGKTIFTVTLPRYANIIGAQTPAPVMPEPKAKGAARPDRIKEIETQATNKTIEVRHTVLIVEDNPEIRQLIKEELQNQYQIIQAENGAEGLQLAVNEIPDIIISDVMMPEMDGYALCKKVKQDDRTSHIPVILLTAKSSQSEQISGLQHGADIYLTKPFSTKVLALNVQNQLIAREQIRNKVVRDFSKVKSPEMALSKSTTPPSFPNSVDNDFLEKILHIIGDHLDDPEFSVDSLSKNVAMSTPILYKKIRALTNMSVNEFIKQQRFKKAAELLLQKQLNINEVSYAVGYDDRKYFSREFKKYFGVVPSEYRGEIRELQIAESEK